MLNELKPIETRSKARTLGPVLIITAVSVIAIFAIFVLGPAVMEIGVSGY